MRLTNAEQDYADRIIEDLTGGDPDGTHSEWLDAELANVLSLSNKGDVRADAIEDTTIRDLIVRAAEKAAIRASESGLIAEDNL